MKVFKLFGKKDIGHNPYTEFNKANHYRPKLSLSEYYKLKGHDFVWFVLEPLCDYDYQNDQIEKLKHFSPLQKALFFWWMLNGQISNGGFVQFYYNEYEKYIPATIDGLILIGEETAAQLITKGHEIYLKEKRKVEKAKEKGLFDSDLYEQLDDLDALNYDYFDLNEQIMAKFESIIRKEPSAFCLDENGNEIETSFTGLIETHFENGKLKDELPFENGQLSGTLKSYFENGNISETIAFANGIETGEKQVFYENGKLKYKVEKDINGDALTHSKFSKSGNIKGKYQTLLDSETKYGAFKTWFENGNLEESGNFNSEGKRSGYWINYFENGQKQHEREYQEEGILIHNCWLENGEQILKSGTGIYKSDIDGYKGKTFYETPYKNYKIHGLYKAIRENGQLHYSIEYIDGKSHGYSRTYYDNGNLKEEKLFENDMEISRQEFPKFKNPKVVVKISYEMEDEWLKTRDIEPADSYPKALNKEKVENDFVVDMSLFEGYSHDQDQSYRYWITVNAKGKASEIEFQMGDNGRILDQIENSIKSIEFKPALKDGKNVLSYLFMRYKFSVVEG